MIVLHAPMYPFFILLFQNLVSESKLVAEELIRISVLNPERWHKALEESSRTFYVEKNIPATVHTLLTIYKEFEKADAQTFQEFTFSQSHAMGLGLASLYLRRFVSANPEFNFDWVPSLPSRMTKMWAINWNHLHDLDQAWQIFYTIFQELSQQISKTSRLDLQYVSPKLKNIQNMHIAVPGCYQ